jgi:hypothetical protein
MNRWPRYLIFFTGCIVLLTFVFASSSQREPTYRGQTLTYWLMKSCFERDAEATAAVRQIGTNALPSLTRWLVYQPSKMKVRLLDSAEKLPRKIGNPLRDFIAGDRLWKVRPDLATYGFSLLGPQAQPAIPELVRALIQNGDTDWRITRVLPYIGEEILPPLVTVMTNRANPKELRADAVRWIRHTHLLNSFAASNLVQCVQDREPEVATEAAFALAETRLEPDLVIPFLTNAVHTFNSLDRCRSVNYISDYAQSARLALPALIELMSDPSLEVRDSVTNALSNIAPELLSQTTAASN